MSKASKSRHCPALGRDISPADCGEQRQSRLSCPGDCVHNPFAPANYSQLLEIEDRLDGKTMGRFVALTPDRGAFQNELFRAERKSVHAIHALVVWNLYFAQDADGSTFAGRWERTGLTELKNDERVLLRGKSQMRIALLEIHKVSEDGMMEAVDLLSALPVPIKLLDRSVAQRAVRFTTVLTWIYPLPHYWRSSGSGVTIPDMGSFTPREIVREIVKHLGGSLQEPEMRRWLAEHFVEFAASLEAVAYSRRRLMLAGMDASYGKAIYELQAPYAQCRERLDELTEVEMDELSQADADEGFAEARTWFDDAPTQNRVATLGGQAVLGRILLGQSHWRLEAMGAEKFARLRQRFEQHLAEKVRFSKERIDDFATQLRTGEPTVDEALAPPRLLENPQQIALGSARGTTLPPGMSQEDFKSEMFRVSEKAFLEDHVPALDTRTPRQAAADPALRPRLIQMMKERVRSHDERNLKSGRTDDINWLLKELDLREIIFAPPPRRPPPVAEDDDEEPWEEEEDDAISVAGAMRPPAPRLPAEAFDFDEAVKRLQDGIEAFGTAAEAMEELGVSGATILDDAEQLTLDDMSDEEFWFAVPYLIQAWFALVPQGCRAPEISYSDLETALVSNLSQILAAAQGGTPKKLEAFFLGTPQPALMTVLMSQFLDTANAGPKKGRLGRAAQSVILALLVSVVELLDRALRTR